MSSWKDTVNWRLLLWVLGAMLIFVIFPIIYHQIHQSSTTPVKNEKTSKVLWGVDSANKVTEKLYQCVNKNFGKPDIWGRYTKTIKGVSTGLTADEIHFLHDKNVRILLIYNHFNNATTKKAGEQEAKAAIQFAKDIKAPNGTAIFADIEPKYPVDSAFIEGWYEIIHKSDYHPGIYGVFDPDQNVYSAFNKAAKNNKSIKENTILWSAAPQKGVSKKTDAPKFNPSGPKDALKYGYQYGIDAKTCNIDTDVFKGEILKYLWK
ncbi:glycoside hydrolase domain-containing protein [Bacillus sp. FJAT-49736]|uniref:glycoside hydrolase domain-containing protein n=1 Tax=Bacillus sp. FJAT-49736 TaxID=2833582 RepID=UPI001BC9178C|nr:glycoside hydrolase domain-containing protein [Bacillus sp. FJAT-49736]MBS4173119.1 DUF1906 domain-containing protein [Bacillus sp. FJAT-49736]